MDTAKVIQVIYCNKSRRGTGKYPDPVRPIIEILDFDGNVIIEKDP